MFARTLALVITIGVVKAQSTSQAVSPIWGQCGGIGWTGPTVCDSASYCQYENAWFSQCLPPSYTSQFSQTSSTSTSRTSSGYWPPYPTVTPSSTTSYRLPSSTPHSGPTTIFEPSTTWSISTSKKSTSTTSSTSCCFSTTRTTTSTTTTHASPSCSASPSSLPMLKGVNLAGFDFGVQTDGSYTGGAVSPPISQIAHFKNDGVNLFRIPFAWQWITPTLGGTLDASAFSDLDAVVQACLKTGAWVILDLHNYARWNTAIINTVGGPTTTEFASVWSQLATKYASNSKIIFGLMNEPHDLPSLTSWASALQVVVNAIRNAGANSQIILLPGSSWSSAAALPTEAGPALLSIIDPVPCGNKLVFDVHQYLDSDDSGTHAECTTNNVSIFSSLTAWLRAHSRYAILSETGGGNTSSCCSLLGTQLQTIDTADRPWITGWAIWAAGAFSTSYVLSVTPNAGTDQYIWTCAVQPNLP